MLPLQRVHKKIMQLSIAQNKPNWHVKKGRTSKMSVHISGCLMEKLNDTQLVNSFRGKVILGFFMSEMTLWRKMLSGSVQFCMSFVGSFFNRLID